MEKRNSLAFSADRRDFLKLSVAAAASLFVVSETSARVSRSLGPVPDYDWLLAKTEEFQENFLLSLPEAEKSDLLSRIRRLRPEAVELLLSRGETGHVLRTWYVGLKLEEKRAARIASAETVATASRILVPIVSPFGPPAVWNASYRAAFFRNMPEKIEPFDLFASENHAVSINRNYGVFDGGRCREHTWDGRPLETFLSLSHGDYVELTATETFTAPSFVNFRSGFEMPAAVMDAKTWTPLCSQVARRLGESFWFPFARWESALASLKRYGSAFRRYSDFSSIPETKTVADVFMKSNAHPPYWHRAFAFKNGSEWFVVDPFSHKAPVSAKKYSRSGDVLAIVAFG